MMYSWMCAAPADDSAGSSTALRSRERAIMQLWRKKQTANDLQGVSVLGLIPHLKLGYAALCVRTARVLVYYSASSS
jgi:hypothetical protein